LGFLIISISTFHTDPLPPLRLHCDLNARFEPRAFATFASAVRRSNSWARSLSQNNRAALVHHSLFGPHIQLQTAAHSQKQLEASAFCLLSPYSIACKLLCYLSAPKDEISLLFFELA